MRVRSEKKRKEIIDTARILFSSNGYLGTSIDSIATSAGTTKRTVYGHFADKRELFLAVIEEATVEFSQLSISIEHIDSEESLIEALHDIAAGINRIIFEPQYVQLVRMVIAEMPSYPELSSLFHRGATRRALELVEELLVAARAQHLITCHHPSNLARMFVGGFTVELYLHGLLSQPDGSFAHPAEDVRLYTEDFIHTMLGVTMA